MKYATVELKNDRKVVTVNFVDGTVTPLLNLKGKHFTDVLDMIRAVEQGSSVQYFSHDTSAMVSIDTVKFLAPIPLPRRNIICVGKNYAEHAKEFTVSGFDSSASSLKDAIPQYPIVFTKFPETVIGPNDLIRYPQSATKQLDYEAELGVVIGRKGSNIPRSEAMDFVFGYTIVNDITARDRQANHKQWFLGKSLDTFCPMGPWVATFDDFDLRGAELRCWVNNELRQRARISDLIFDIPTLISTISEGITLYPGDIIATGTPAGVGIGFNPPKFLSPGDEIAIEIDGLGRLVNRVA